MGLTMAERRAVTTAIATPLQARRQAGEGEDPRRAVRHDRLASRSCPQGIAGGFDPEGGTSPDRPPTGVRDERCCGVDLLLGGAGNADGKAAGAGTG